MNVVVFYPATLWTHNGNFVSASPQHLNIDIWRRNVSSLAVVAMVDPRRRDSGPYSASFEGVEVLSLPPAYSGKEAYFSRLPGIAWGIIRHFLSHHREWDVVVLFQPGLHNQLAYVLARLFRKPVILRLTGRHDLSIREAHRHSRSGWRRTAGMLHARWATAAQVMMSRSCFLATDGDVSFARRLTITDNQPEPGKTALFLVESFFEETDLDLHTRSDRGSLFRMLSLSRIHPQKDLETLVRAASRLRSMGVPIRLDIVGPTYGAAYDGYEFRLRGLINELGLADDVFLHGWVDGAALAHLWHEADALVATCRSNADGVPKVILEAMFRGVPVVASSVGGIPRVLSDGPAGLLVPPGNASALADKLQQLANDPAMVQRLCVEAWTRARASHSATAVAREFGRLARWVGRCR